MRKEVERTQDGVASGIRNRSTWSAPRLTVIPVSELTKGVGGFNFDGDFSPQS